MGNNHWLKGLSGIFCLKKFFFLLGSHGLGHVQLWDLDHKEGRVPKSWCFQNVVLEKTLESPLNCKEIQLVNPEGNQPWIFIGRTEVEASILWPPDSKNWFIGKDPDAAKDWRQEKKGSTEGERVGLHHGHNEHEFEQSPGDSEGNGCLACYSPWVCNDSDMA